MASRFNQQRDTARSSLFSGYDQRSTNASNPQRSRPTSTSTSPNPYTASYGYNDPGSSNNNNNTFSAYPSHNTNTGASQNFRTATPDRRGNMYSDSVLSELESQNDDQVSEMSKKVGMLKDLTLRIGDEIRDSTALAEKMNDQFSNTSTKLKGTMKRMLRMAEKTGVGWKVWLMFFAFVIALFWYVWLF